ncbi:alpha/beta hydrolase [Kitasatospora paracochleata]|uniref:Pimeloyl-ACP methyl ester carboxylesterase n=1 Tax=Kitasatospora paracochleata TaxID=58354 RepID=A0ABT1IUI5_9ACTN|nr:alpha/beta hydrolase [Kitasatospora paracochleata]MCP2308800.1 pimeloyl-ACP methyl ester carboxylesterase [Kitasatospora paracochleata]
MTETSIPVAGVPTFDTFASADGPLAYRDAGPRDGRPLVLLHASFVDHTQFDNLVPGLVAHGYRVIAPDARGHGFSANASRPFRQTDDLAALLRHLDLDEPAVLVGVSMGAMIGVDTAVEHPELVRALVVSGRGIGEPDPSDPWTAARGQAQFAALMAGDIPGWLEQFTLWIAGPTRTLADVDPALVDHVRDMALRTLMKHSPGEVDHTVPVQDVAGRARGITVPVLAIDGALDAPGVLATVDALLSAVPHGRATRLDGAAHFTTSEQPEEFTRILLAFLAELDEPQA